MKTYFKALLMLAAIAGLFVPTVAVAQKSAGGVVGEARLHPGTWGNQRTSRSGMRSRPMYRSPAPVIVRTEPAPRAVAQAPTEQRSFSYEPSQQAETAKPCPDSVTIESGPDTAQRPTRTYRSFSYEPAIEAGGEPAVRTYSAPRMRSSRPMRSRATERYLLPKTDPRKYRN